MMNIFKMFSSESTIQDNQTLVQSAEMEVKNVKIINKENSASSLQTDDIDLIPPLLNMNVPTVDNSAKYKEIITSLEKKICEMEANEKRLTDELITQKNETQEAAKVITELESIITGLLKERDKLEDHKNTALTHLANIEHAFSDINAKYERAKSYVQQYKENEDVLKYALQNNEVLLRYRENKYQQLKTHAAEKFQEVNVEVDKMKKTYTIEIAKLKAMVKKSECKIKCLEEQLEQKVAENAQMALLWEDLNSNIQNESFSDNLNAIKP